MKLERLLKWYLLITSIYLLFDGLIHVFDFKLIDVKDWSEQSIIYSQYISRLYGLFVVLAALIGIEISRDLKKYKNILPLGAGWGVVYGVFLIYYSLNIDFVKVFSSTPSIYFWIPFYNYFIVFEALLLFILAALAFIYRRNS